MKIRAFPGIIAGTLQPVICNPKQLLVMITFFIALSVNAQDYKVDLKKAADIYSKKAFEVQMEYLFYSSYTTVQPLEKESVGLKKQGQQFNMMEFGIQTIYDEKYLLVIDKENQIIAIDRKREQAKGKMDPKMKTKLDDAMKKFAAKFGLDTIKTSSEDNFKADYLGIKNGKKGYAFNYKYGEYEKTIIYIDAQNYNLSNMIIYYRQPMELEEGKFSKVRVEINYLKQVADPVFPKETFSMKKFIDIKSNGEVIPNVAYKDYTVINHLVKPKEEVE